jgi:hypothetical protein
MTQRASLRGMQLDSGEIAMPPPFFLVAHTAFAFERAKDGQHGGVGKLVFQVGPDFGDDGGAAVSEYLHDIGFTIGEMDERRAGLSRSMIRKYLRSDVVEPSFQAPDRPSKLDPFAEKLQVSPGHRLILMFCL